MNPTATKPPRPRIKFVVAFKELFNKYWRLIIFYGGRSGGKSRAVAESLIIRGQNEKLRILCTRQVQNTIRDSVHKLLKDTIERYEFTDYEVGNDSITNKKTGTEFIFKGLQRNIMEIKSLEGIDVAWVEEAHSVTDEAWDILIPTIRKPGSQIIITFNRQFELDPVYQRFVMKRRPKSYVRKVNFDVLEKAGYLSEETKLEMEADRENPSTFAHIWLGEPISQSETSIINRDNALLAMQREIEPDGHIIVGVDVARMGSDRTVFWARKGLRTIKKQVFSKLRTTEVCDHLERFMESLIDREDGETDRHFANRVKGIELRVDDTGVGGGVTDEMMKREYKVIAINFGGEAKDKDKYPNMISEAWFEFDENLPEMQLPYDSDLLMELTTRQWKQDNKGKRRIESKEEYKKRGFRSPDLADACIICYYTPRVFGVKVYEDKPDIF